MASGKEMLLAVVPGEGGDSVLRYARVEGKRILKTGDEMPSRATGAMRVSVFSSTAYFDQADLAVPSLKVLPMVARRYVDAELIFDESYRLCARSHKKRERTVTTDIAAIPELDLDVASSMLPLEERPCLQMVPLELAIAALVRKATSEPVVVFWEKGGTLLALLVVDGMVRGRTREQVNDDNREIIIARAETSLRGTATRYGEGKDVFLVLRMGDLVDHVPEEREQAAQVFEKKLSGLYRTRRGVAKDAVLRDPELYGLPFVDESWNFLDKEYRDQVQSWRYARPAAALAGLVGVGFALAGGFQHLQALDAESDFDTERAQLQQTKAEIERMLPSDEAMETVRKGLKVQLDSLSELRLDRLLGWLTHSIPEGVVVRNLRVNPAERPRGRRGAPMKYPPGEKPFDVSMEIMLSETSFDAAEASSAELIRRFSERLQILDSRLEVPIPEPGAKRNVVLVVSAHGKAVNF